MACSNTAWLKSPYILVFHPLTVDLTIISSLVASFSDLHLSFQSRFPRLSLSPLRFPFFFCPIPSLQQWEKPHFKSSLYLYAYKTPEYPGTECSGSLTFLLSFILSFSVFFYLHLPTLPREERRKEISLTTNPSSFRGFLSHTCTHTHTIMFLSLPRTLYWHTLISWRTVLTLTSTSPTLTFTLT